MSDTLFTSAELDYAISNMTSLDVSGSWSGISTSGTLTSGSTSISFEDVGVTTSGSTATVDLGGAYANTSLLSFATHSTATV